MNVIENDEITEKYPRVLYFTASWCGPCKRISPVFEKLAEDTKGIEFFKIDVDINPKLSVIYDIKSMPTFILFSSESSFTRFSGADSNKLLASVEKLKK